MAMSVRIGWVLYLVFVVIVMLMSAMMIHNNNMVYTRVIEHDDQADVTREIKGSEISTHRHHGLRSGGSSRLLMTTTTSVSGNGGDDGDDGDGQSGLGSEGGGSRSNLNDNGFLVFSLPPQLSNILAIVSVVVFLLWFVRTCTACTRISELRLAMDTRRWIWLDGLSSSSGTIRSLTRNHLKQLLLDKRPIPPIAMNKTPIPITMKSAVITNQKRFLDVTFQLSNFINLDDVSIEVFAFWCVLPDALSSLPNSLTREDQASTIDDEEVDDKELLLDGDGNNASRGSNVRDKISFRLPGGDSATASAKKRRSPRPKYLDDISDLDEDTRASRPSKAHSKSIGSAYVALKKSPSQSSSFVSIPSPDEDEYPSVRHLFSKKTYASVSGPYHAHDLLSYISRVGSGNILHTGSGGIGVRRNSSMNEFHDALAEANEFVATTGPASISHPLAIPRGSSLSVKSQNGEVQISIPVPEYIALSDAEKGFDITQIDSLVPLVLGIQSRRGPRKFMKILAVHFRKVQSREAGGGSSSPNKNSPVEESSLNGGENAQQPRSPKAVDLVAMLRTSNLQPGDIQQQQQQQQQPGELNSYAGYPVRHIYVTPSHAFDLFEVYGFDQDPECVVCLSEEKNVILVPCRHLCVCKECLKHIDKCPVCRSTFTSYITKSKMQLKQVDAGSNGKSSPVDTAVI